jgi:iron complex transport system ATP-binding protein
MALIELDRITFSYDDVPAVRELSLSVGEGDFLGIVGPNGSGKSTLLKLIDGLLVPNQGTVLLSGRPSQQYKRPELARKVAIVPQTYTLDFDFTARQVVEMGRYCRRGEAGRGVVDGLLQRLDVQALAGRPFSELSGGEKQMFVLAQALAQQPEVLLLDEPASHLDVSHQLALFDMLVELNSDGLTVVCVLHDLNLALLYFNRMAMLSEGGLFAEGATEAVLSPEMISSVYGVQAYMHRHAGRTFLTFSPRRRPARKLRVHLICGGGTGANLMRRLLDLGYRVSAGVVNAMDTDEVTGRELGLPLAAEAPFTTITDTSYRDNTALITDADLVVLTAMPIGAGNFKNVVAARQAAESGKRVLAVSGVEQRDFTRSAAAELGQAPGLRYVAGDDQVVEALEEIWESSSL